MRIGVVGAMSEEVERLRLDLAAASERSIGMRTYASGRLYGSDAVVVFSRFGKVAAAATAVTLIQLFGADMIVFTGVAGGAAPDLRIGDIVVADRLVQHDLDLRPLGLERFTVPLLDKDFFPVDASLVALARQSASEYVRLDLEREIPADVRARFGIERPAVRVGTIASGDQFMADPQRIADLREAIPGLLCVEMEGAAVAQVCFELGVPCLVLRVISDLADESAGVDFAQFVESVASRFTSGAVRRLVRVLGAG